MDDKFIRIVDMDITTKAVTVLDNESDYNIYINARWATNEQITALKHELQHINRGDFYRDADIYEKETMSKEVQKVFLLPKNPTFQDLGRIMFELKYKSVGVCYV